MKKSLIRYIPFFALLIFASIPAAAQQDSTKLKQEVEVVKAYRPSVSDAFKINDIPKIKEDKNKKKPTFTYKIKSQPVTLSSFDVEPVQAAQMVGEPKAELGKGLLKIGVGNYLTPYGEFFYNTNTGKNSNFGMHFKHLSSHGRVKLMNTDKVDAPESENVAELFTNHFFRRATLSTNLFYNRQAQRYYGYTGPILTDPAKTRLIPYFDEKQAFSKGGIQLRLSNAADSRAPLAYDANLYYHFFGTQTGQTENLAKISTDLKQEFDSFYGILNASVGYLRTDSIFNETSNNYGHKQQILINASPAILFEGDIARLQLGVHMFMLFDDDASARVLFTPNIKAEWSPVEGVLTLFANADGKLQQNHYSSIVSENPFVDPYQDIKNTEYRYILSGGIKGKFTPRFNYRFQADYANIRNQHFYMLNNLQAIENGAAVTTKRNNTFDVVYDNSKQFTLETELYYTASDLVNFHLTGNYYSYQLENLEYPWQKPNFDATISAILNPDGPMKFNADVFITGERKALIREGIYDPLANGVGPTIVNDNIYTMSSIVDLNFGMEYQYSPQLSFFGRANNFAFQKYENWMGYTQQSFNLLIGASYSF